MEPALVLVVDDDPVSRRFAADVLEVAGYRTLCCDALAAARPALESARPSVILCDLGLPDGSGLLLREAALEVPFVAMSAEMSEANARKLLRQGCHAALEKPVTAEHLVATIAAAVARRAAPGHIVPSPAESLVLDLRAALAATGSEDIAAGLRGLFLAELPAQREAIARALAAEDVSTVREALHRLRSACAFCGAMRLRDAGERLAAALSSEARAERAGAHATFDAAIADTIAALQAADAAA